MSTYKARKERCNMNKINNAAIKKMVKTIEGQLNKHEDYEEFWSYKLQLKKNEIECKIYDDEDCREDYLEYAFVVNIAQDVTTIIKSCINYIYEWNLNDLQKYVKATAGYNKRHIKSLSCWIEKGKQEKVDKLVRELADRYKTTKSKEFEISKFRDIIKDFYNCMTELSPEWRLESIKEKVFTRCEKLNIKNVGISCRDNKLIVIKHDEEIHDVFDIVIDGYCNIGQTVSTIVNRLAKEVA